GGGTIVPVTGFANTLASAAIEHRSEGFVLGVGGNMFKIAGPVITFGVFAAFVIGTITVLIKTVGGM
ncbi:MAG TPA: SpoVA/SpoVAEb family sporulation membrane protein, partial [Bacillota bacterium]|nr:SpoVA/SpoVAEb family sporulation membrane protein [Bacillota bacterium]